MDGMVTAVVTKLFAVNNNTASAQAQRASSTSVTSTNHDGKPNGVFDRETSYLLLPMQGETDAN